MCGIVGIFNSYPELAPQEIAIRRMLGMIRHRGPDEFGIYLGDRVALGNARLSIVDLSGGQQPIANEDGSMWIVYNGEVFNYVELRAELEARGHKFSTHTDTEVILHLYEDLGPACLSRLNGQFAIAIYNERDSSLFLARDRLGVRPLFYSKVGSELVFASEIKAILAYPELSAQFDPVALDQVFTYWSALGSRTCFRGVVSLLPGHYLLAKADKIEIAPYWQLDFAKDPRAKPQDAQTYIEQFR